jgi:arginine N-succinyltransferase
MAIKGLNGELLVLVIRPVREPDIDGLLRLADLAGEGMTSLPQDREALQRNIQTALTSFSSAESNSSDYFLMVLEDTSRERVIGTAAVYARTGTRQAFYAYREMSVTHYSHSLNREIRSSMLHLTNDYTDYSEMGTLFLDPEYRGNGRWLSRSRYMLLGLFPDRFAEHVIAELRGWLDASGNSPFWQAIGSKFFNMSYSEADRLCGVGSNQFITELMPKHPIYTNLLPDEAVEVMGKPHQDTRRAMELLLEEGFEYENMIDIFDGGPLVRARVSRLHSVEALTTLPLQIVHEVSSTPKLIANTNLKDFRVLQGSAEVVGDHIRVGEAEAAQLQLIDGDRIALIE